MCGKANFGRYALVLVALLSWAGTSFAIGDGPVPATVKEDLAEVYKSNPGLRTETADLVFFEKEATRILGDKTRVESLVQFMKGDLAQFQTVRSEVINQLIRSEKPAGRVVVSGQSVTGMLAAAVAAQDGYQVDGFDLREGFTRNIRWATRQTMADELASVDPALAEKFISEVVELKGRSLGPKSNGRAGSRGADPRNIARTGAELMAQKPDGAIDVKIFEHLLLSYVVNHPNVHRRTGTVSVGKMDPHTGKYEVTLLEGGNGARTPTETFEPDFLMVAEGKDSETGKRLGVRMLETSPSRLQVAGFLETRGQAGQFFIRYRVEGGRRMVSMIIGVDGDTKVGMVADIDPKAIAADNPAEAQQKIDQEFKRIAAVTLQIPASDLDSTKTFGTVGNGPIRVFDIQQKIAEKAAFGSNVLLMADSAGNAHWSSGTGGLIGGVSHVERFKTLLAKVAGGYDRAAAMQEYSDGVLADTRAWSEATLYQFYDRMSQPQGREAFRLAILAYEFGQVQTPYEALNLMLPDGRATESVGARIDAFRQRLEGICALAGLHSAVH